MYPNLQLSLFLLLPTITILSKTSNDAFNPSPKRFGRISETEYILTPEQIETYHREGCVSCPDVLTPAEMDDIDFIFNKFLNREIHVPGKDFCDMSKPFDTPFEEWSIVNCMLPTRYYPEWNGNVYEKLTECIVKQLHPTIEMKKDYDQLLNKRPGKEDAVFAMHQDMGYWPGVNALGVTDTTTCTFSLAVDDSDEENGCLHYIVGSGKEKFLRSHKPLAKSRDEGHALTVKIDESSDILRLAPCKRGSITIHDEWVVHGSSGNKCHDRQRRTYVLAYRTREMVEAERKIGFTHSHNDEVNWDSFSDGVERK